MGPRDLEASTRGPRVAPESLNGAENRARRLPRGLSKNEKWKLNILMGKHSPARETDPGATPIGYVPACLCLALLCFALLCFAFALLYFALRCVVLCLAWLCVALFFWTTRSAKSTFLRAKSATGIFWQLRTPKAILGFGDLGPRNQPWKPKEPSSGGFLEGSLRNPGLPKAGPSHPLLWNPVRTPSGRA